MFSALGYSPRFKAAGSWDYRILEPIIFKILTDLKYPSLISDTVVEDALLSHGVPGIIGGTRLRHCISRALKAAGYKKGSLRGHAWEFSWICVKDVHPVKKKSILHRVRTAIEGMVSIQTTLDLWIQ